MGSRAYLEDASQPRRAVNEQALAATSSLSAATGLVTAALNIALPWLQAAALIVAIVSGVLAIRAHFKKK